MFINMLGVQQAIQGSYAANMGAFNATQGQLNLMRQAANVRNNAQLMRFGSQDLAYAAQSEMSRVLFQANQLIAQSERQKLKQMLQQNFSNPYQS